MAPQLGGNKWPPAVVTKHQSPRSYIVNSGGHLFSRNRQYLAPATQVANGPDAPEREQDATSTDGEARTAHQTDQAMNRTTPE